MWGRGTKRPEDQNRSSTPFNTRQVLVAAEGCRDARGGVGGGRAEAVSRHDAAGQDSFWQQLLGFVRFSSSSFLFLEGCTTKIQCLRTNGRLYLSSVFLCGSRETPAAHHQASREDDDYYDDPEPLAPPPIRESIAPQS